jgi:hypothetical protein
MIAFDERSRGGGTGSCHPPQAGCPCCLAGGLVAGLPVHGIIPLITTSPVASADGSVGVGEVSEWLKEPHSKCGLRETAAGVRIPPSPVFSTSHCAACNPCSLKEFGAVPPLSDAVAARSADGAAVPIVQVRCRGGRRFHWTCPRVVAVILSCRVPALPMSNADVAIGRARSSTEQDREPGGRKGCFMASLVITNGDQAGTQFRIASRPLTGGRDPARDIQITDPKVSRKHFQIRKDEDEYLVVEFKSTNGIYVNGTKISGKQILKDGDQLQVGDTALTFYLADDLDKTNALDKFKLADRSLREDRTIQ